MAQFLDSLCITEIDDSLFEVCDHPFRYASDIGGLITVNIGFRTDFASVPRLGIIYAMLGNYAHQPAVIHDYLYATAITDRKTADNILLEAMSVIGLPWWRMWPIFAGVRMGGWHAWNQHRKEGDLSTNSDVVLHDQASPESITLLSQEQESQSSPENDQGQNPT